MGALWCCLQDLGPSMAFHADRWAFLCPWLAPVRGRLLVEPQEHLLKREPRSKRLDVTLSLPGRSEGVTPKLVREMRDALVLLSLVARVDCQAWAHVISTHCGVGSELETAMKLLEDGQFDELSFSISYPRARDFNNQSMAEMITELVDNTMQTSSRALSVAVKQVLMRASPDSRLRNDPRVDISVGLYLNVSRFSPLSNIVWPMLVARHDRTGCWRFPVRLTPDLGVDCAFVLGPLLVGTSGGSPSAVEAMLLDGIATNGGGIDIDNMAITTGVRESKGNARDIQAQGKLCERLLCAGTRAEDQRACIRSLEFFVDECNWFQAARVLTAVAQARTTKKVSLHLDDLMLSGGDEGRRGIWQGVAFAVFSRFARTHSSITSVELTWPTFSVSNADAVAEILDSADPFRVLFGNSFPPNVAQVANHIYPTKMLQRGTRVMLVPFNNAETIPEESASWELATDVAAVNVLHDDASESTVLVLVPGYGPCRVERSELTPASPLQLRSNDITDLSIVCMNEDDIYALSGVIRLLQMVGEPLQKLSLDLCNVQVPSFQSILACCPRLKALTIKGSTTDTHSLICASRASEVRLDDITCRFDDPLELMTELSNGHSRFTKSLKGVTCIIPDNAEPWSDPVLEAVETMLHSNKTLQHLRLIVPKHLVQDFAATSMRVACFHMNQLPVVGKPLPLACRLALLSALAPSGSNRGGSAAQLQMRDLEVLDRELIKKIFDLAAARALRRVIVSSREW